MNKQFECPNCGETFDNLEEFDEHLMENEC